MAPEQYQLQPLDARTDVYALGSLLYRLLTGAYPATGSSVEEIRDKILRGAFPRLDSLRPDVPKALGDVIRKAMETDPRKRFQNAAEMAAALAAIGNRTPAPAPASPVKAPGGLASKLGEPSRLVIGLLVAILMCLFAAVGLLIALIINKSS
jgi:serine/threonine protein kinase